MPQFGDEPFIAAMLVDHLADVLIHGEDIAKQMSAFARINVQPLQFAVQQVEELLCNLSTSQAHGLAL